MSKLRRLSPASLFRAAAKGPTVTSIVPARAAVVTKPDDAGATWPVAHALSFTLGGVNKSLVVSPEHLAKGGFGTVYPAFDRRDPTHRYVIKDVGPTPPSSLCAAARTQAPPPMPAGCGQAPQSEGDVEREMVLGQLAKSAAAPFAALRVGSHVVMLMHPMPASFVDIERALRGETPAERSRVTLLVLAQTLTELSRLHKNGKMHHDIKLDNLLLAPGSAWQKPRATLSDFGLATDVAAADTFQGTLDYMPPEMLDGKLSQAYDIWGLGVTALELATGRFLFGEHNADAPFMGRAQRFRAYRAGVPDAAFDQVFAMVHHRGLREVIESMLAADPRARPAAGKLLARVNRLRVFQIPWQRARAWRFLARQHGLADKLSARLKPIERALSGEGAG